MNLRDLECFLAVADELHFGHAADRLHLAQPTVSEAVRRLERQLGGDLFDRSTRNVSLTDLGTSFLDEAREAYQRVETAYATGRRLAHRRAEQFVIGSAIDDGTLLVAGVAELRRHRPSVTVVVEEMGAADQVEALRQRRIDAGIGWLPPADEGIGSLVVGTCGYVAVVPDTSPLARLAVLPLAQLATEPLITWARSTNPPLYDRFAEAMNATGLPWSLVATATGLANLASRVMSGQGVGAVPAPAPAGRPFEGLAYVPLGDGAPVLDRTLIWSKRTPHLLLPVFTRIARRLWDAHPQTRRAQPEPVFGGGEHASSSSARAQPEPGFGGGEHVPSSPGHEVAS